MAQKKLEERLDSTVGEIGSIKAVEGMKGMIQRLPMIEEGLSILSKAVEKISDTIVDLSLFR